ncbi:hypothetical protein D778_01407 [Xanthomarina gelatinilytica]|uniref:Uncharacterized protein n=1 Tax=Xanthomarina gelatinilytica TaxID=1137281 RepID=M7MG98_9FLAO|nr:hypothetical protein D778_01407 [Xanthomarina gelatinilytica]
MYQDKRTSTFYKFKFCYCFYNLKSQFKLSLKYTCFNKIPKPHKPA